ncbi:SDR family oxidoreductase [Pedobacter zeae]|uniref:NAD(P)-dependent dehydrogenase (Short-subunit alcohol dehydrogenase family) n=1 Tax=Pedobacter zeae TaxID=1737356 RepID=A0A7W6KD97_9SPHI|nr:SDR family oxidoreductase [Pedobacter zeae]MBB4108437.1 NAD(P)-dependent dehydrogenase (short-subunit alcohol dehydrogenase family) [Pedobacter zeae]GGG92809.1 short-chain dehydrogenase/reductase [Pedobacter zeae]
MSKTIFITGASSGLGKATAKLFHNKGWQVIATMRSPEKETELSQLPNVTLLALDVTDPQQINAVADKVSEAFELDVVFNNAGYGLSGALEAISEDQLLRQINTNLLGVIRVTKAFIPYFRTRGKGLFITTTSLGGLIGFPFSSLYHATKWALEGWSESMAYELKSINVGIKVIEPGAIATNFMDRSYDKAFHPAYDELFNRFFANVDDVTFTPAEKIAEVVYEAATDGKDQLRYLAGDDAKAIYQQRLALGDEAFRQFMAQTFLGQ